MLDALAEVERFTQSLTVDQFREDRLVLFATVRALEIVGEAANSVTQATRDAHPHIPWRLIVDMRNRLIHGYFDINPDIVWETARVEAPALAAQLRDIITP